MKEKEKEPRTECVYCGSPGPLTDDHVPPKSFFPRPRPNNLIVVPSCRPCNQGASLDDEYFRLAATLREDAYEQPSVQRLLPAVYRSLQKPKKLRYSRSFMKSITEVIVSTPAGIQLGRRPAYNVDLTRLDRVAARVAKGLFHRERGARLPKGYQMIAYNESGMAHITAEVAENLRRKILEPLWSAPEITIGGDVFSYRFRFVDIDQDMSAWLLVFFKVLAFICISVPDNVAAMRPRMDTVRRVRP